MTFDDRPSKPWLFSREIKSNKGIQTWPPFCATIQRMQRQSLEHSQCQCHRTLLCNLSCRHGLVGIMPKFAKKIKTPDDTESHRGNTTLEIIEFAPSSCTLNQLRLWSFIFVFVLLEATNIQKGFILGDWITFHSCLAGDWRGCARAS